MSCPFLITLEAGGFDCKPKTADVPRVVSEGVYALASRATEGEFKLFVSGSNQEIGLGEYPQNQNCKAKSISDFITPESDVSHLMRSEAISTENMIVDDEILWIHLIVLTKNDGHWDHNFKKASEVFHEACATSRAGGFGSFYIFGPLNDRIIFNAFENGEIVDGWGEHPIDGDPSGLIVDSSGFMQANNLTRMEGVNYMLDRYWGIKEIGNKL